MQALEAAAGRLVQTADDRTTPDAKRSGPAGKEDRPDRDAPRLFFDLSSARLIPNCLVADSRIQKSRGPFDDVWDQGFILSHQGMLGADGPIEMSYLLLFVVLLLSVEWLTRKLLKLA
jgi:hypothetical protein